jgi:hypothetical protein
MDKQGEDVSTHSKQRGSEKSKVIVKADLSDELSTGFQYLSSNGTAD